MTVSCNFSNKEVGIDFPDEDLVVSTTKNAFEDYCSKVRGRKTHVPVADFIGGPYYLQPCKFP